jgi:DNA-binding NarL/FixJ family response regulator
MTATSAVVGLVRVYVVAADPFSSAAVAALLRGRPECDLVSAADVGSADVALVVAEAVDAATLGVLRALRRDGCPRSVLLVAHVDAAAVAAAAQAGVVGVVRRAQATRDGLWSALRAAAAGEGVLPADLLGGLMRQVQGESFTGPGVGRSGPSDREVRVLRLLSEGCDTREIARRLAYSERTVKNVIADVTRRFGLRNRSHAVAFALRQGLI